MSSQTVCKNAAHAIIILFKTVGEGLRARYRAVRVLLGYLDCGIAC
jgi:hypothetical protein